MGRKRLAKPFVKTGTGHMGPRPAYVAALESENEFRAAVQNLERWASYTATAPKQLRGKSGQVLAVKIFNELRAEGKSHAVHPVAERAGCGWTNADWLKKRLSG